MKVVIIGGVAGGASFATRARRLNEAAKLIMLEKSGNASFANCGMPYYLGGEIAKRNDLIVISESILSKRYNLDVRIKTEVVEILRDQKKVRVKDLAKNQEYFEDYDKLVLAMGASPLKPPMEGINLDRIFTLRNLEDMDQIKPFVKQGAKCVVVGGGFIGVEVAEQLAKSGVQTSIVEMLDQIMPPFDREMVIPLMETLSKNGVKLMLQEKCQKFTQTQSGGVTVHLDGGKQLDADFVIMSIGVKPDTKLASDAKLDVNQRGGIKVSENMLTSDPDIYAVGDCVEVKDVVLNQYTQIPLAGIANRQGRIAADHMFGVKPDVFRGAQGTSIVTAFDVTLAGTGANEKTLKRMNIPYHKIYTHAFDHASYYPGGKRMHLKLLFSPTDGKILGGQVVGGKVGVDTRIDVLATAIQAGFTVYDLEEIEMAYCPHYGSAKDPINHLGFIGAGVMRGDQRVVILEEAMEDAKANKILLLDVRTPNEFSQGTLPNAKHVPLEELRNHVEKEMHQTVSKDTPIVTFCRIGQRGYMAQRVLEQFGYTNVRNITGGYELYDMIKSHL